MTDKAVVGLRPDTNGGDPKKRQEKKVDPAAAAAQPLIRFGDTIYLTLAALAPQLEGFLSHSFSTVVATEYRNKPEWREPVSGFQSNLWILEPPPRKEAKQRKATSKPLVYGQNFVLRHKSTGYYMTLQRGTVFAEAGEMQVLLSDSVDASQRWNFEPANKARSKGANVHINDNVTLNHLTYSFALRVTDHVLDSYGRTAALASNLGTPLRLLRYSVPIDRDSLSAGDVVGIFHQELDGTLSLDKTALLPPPGSNTPPPPLATDLKAPFLRMLTGEDVDDKPLDKLSEIYRLERADLMQGGPIYWYSQVFIRHVLTGKYLSVETRGISLSRPGDPDDDFTTVADRMLVAELAQQQSTFSDPALGERRKSHAPTTPATPSTALRNLAMSAKKVPAPPSSLGNMGNMASSFMDRVRGNSKDAETEIVLTDERTPAALWRMYPTAMTTDPTSIVRRDDVIRLRHATARTRKGRALGFFLRASAGDEIAVKPTGADNSRVLADSNDVPNPKLVKATHADSLDDIWTFKPFPRGSTSIVYTVADEVRRLQEYLAHPISITLHLGDVLGRLNGLAGRVAAIRRNKKGLVQDSMVELGGADVALDLLSLLSEVPGSPLSTTLNKSGTPKNATRGIEFLGKPAASMMKKVVKAAIALLTSMSRANPAASARVYAHYDFIMDCVTGSKEDIGGLETVDTMFKASHELCGEVTVEDIEQWLNLGKTRPDLFNKICSVLSTLCHTTYRAYQEKGLEGNAWRTHTLLKQNIGKAIFDKRHKEYIQNYSVDKDRLYLAVNKKAVISLAKLATPERTIKDAKELKKAQVMYRNHVALLELYVAITLGRTPRNEDVLRDLFPMDVLMRALRMEGAIDIKSKLVAVLREVYINTEENTPFSIDYTKFYDKARDTKVIKLAGYNRSAAFEPFLKWLNSSVEHHIKHPSNNVGTLSLLVQIFRAVRDLLAFNQFYTTEDPNFEPFLRGLLKLLMWPLPKPTDPEFTRKSVYIAYAAKLEVCNVFTIVDDILLNQRMQFVYNRFIDEDSGKAMTSKQELNSGLASSRLERYIGKWTNAAKFLLAADDFALNKVALELLPRIEKDYVQTFEALRQMKVLVGANLGDVTTRVPKIIRAFSDWAATESGVAKNKKELIKMVNYLHGRLYGTDDFDPENVPGSRPLKAVQDLYRGYNLHQALVRILARPFEESLRTVFRTCYSFLVSFIRRNSENQTAMVPFISLMQSQMGSSLGVAPVMQQLLGEGNYDVTAAVTPAQIDFFASLPLNNKLPYYLKLLSSLCVTSGKPIKRNQTSILNTFHSNREELFSLMSTKEERAERLRLVKAGDLEDEKGTLAYHVAFIDLLAATCFKRNETSINLCRTYMEMADVLSVIRNQNLPEPIRAAHWNFLRSVYLDSNPNDLTDDERALLPRVVGLLAEFAKDMAGAKDKSVYSRLLRHNVLPCVDVLVSTYVTGYDTARPENEWLTELRTELNSQYMAIMDGLVDVGNSFNFDDVQTAIQDTLEVIHGVREVFAWEGKLLPKVEKFLDKMASMATQAEKKKAQQGDVGPDGEIDDRVPRRKWRAFLDKYQAQFQGELDREVRHIKYALADFEDDTIKKIVTLPETSQGEDVAFFLFVLESIQSLLVTKKDENRKGRAIISEEPLPEQQSRVDALGGTRNVMLLMATLNNRLKYRAVETLYMLLKGGNPTVQATVLKACDVGIGDDSELNILEEVQDIVREVTGDVRSSSWWITGGAGVEGSKSGRDEDIGPQELLDVTIAFVKQLCEGHNNAAQDLLREQDNSLVNVIRSLVQYFDALVPSFIPDPFNFNAQIKNAQEATQLELVKGLTEPWYQPILDVLDTLVETIQGPCVGNQRELLNNIGVETMKTAFALPLTVEDYLEKGLGDARLRKIVVGTSMERKFMSAVADLALACLEGPEFAQHVQVMNIKDLVVPVHARMESLNELVERYNRSDSALADEILEDAFAMYRLMKYLATDETEALSREERVLANARFPQFEKRLGRIELLRDGFVLPVFFMTDKVGQYFEKEDHQKLLYEVDRSNVNEKTADFWQQTQVVYKTWKIREEVRSRAFSRVLTSTKVQLVLRRATNLLVLAINAGLIYLSPTEEEYLGDAGPYTVLGYGLIVSTSIQFLAYALLRNRIQASIEYAEMEEKLEEEAEALGEEFKLTFADKVNLRLRSSFHPGLLYQLMLILFAYLGVLTQNPWWHAYGLTDVLIQSPVMKNVLRSVTKNSKSLLLTFVLMLVLVYFYAIVGYFFFQRQLDADEEGNPTGSCTDIFTCFAVILGQFPSGGDFLRMRMLFSAAGREDGAWGSFWELVYQISFFVSVMLIMLNILFGIIVDTFSELRQERDEIEEDLSNRCFVCNVDGSLFERNTRGFDHHIENEHFVPHYLQWYAYLKEKHERDGGVQEFDGNESYVWDLMEADSVAWYPQNRAFSLYEHELKEAAAAGGKKDFDSMFASLLGSLGTVNRKLGGLDKDLRGKEKSIVQIRSHLGIVDPAAQALAAGSGEKQGS